MGRRPRIITSQDINTLQVQHGFRWLTRKSVPDSKQYGQHRYLHLTCGGCNVMHWVSWTSLKTGSSHCCRQCSTLPDIKEFADIKELHQAKWSPVLPLRWKLTPERRRSFLMKCSCGTESFVRWAKFAAGEAKACRSCATHLRTHGLSEDPLYRTWRSLKSEGRELCKSWQSFSNFKKWAKPLWAEGFKLIRHDKTKPYGPDTCDYVVISKKDLVTDEIVLARGQQRKLPSLPRSSLS